jgi:diaminopimelate decarboxylase
MLPFISYIQGRLTIDGVGAESLAASFGTPLYVYSANAVRERFAQLQAAFAPLRPTICYAIKANSNIHLCRLLASLGAGMDVVSGGELERAWLSGVPMSNVVFAGTGKAESEILAALVGSKSPLVGTLPVTIAPPDNRGPVGWFNVESEQELERIARIAQTQGVVARCALRVNPDVDAKTHKFTTTGKHENKFGVPIERAVAIFERFRDHRSVFLRGLHCHLGSPIATPTPYVEGLRALTALMDRLETQKIPIQSLNIGGGFGVDYGNNAVEPIESFAHAINPLLADRVERGLRVIIEPGRWIIANAGVLLTRIQYIKDAGTASDANAEMTRTFAICDAGVHTLIRPALYNAHHTIWPAITTPELALNSLTPDAHISPTELLAYDVVGPICESTDFLAKARLMPKLSQGDLLAVFSAGAYGMSMASTYNDHPKPAEVMVDSQRVIRIRARQTAFSLIADELAPG